MWILTSSSTSPVQWMHSIFGTQGGNVNWRSSRMAYILSTGIFEELNCFLASVKLGLVLTTGLKFRLCLAGRGRSLVTLSAVRWTWMGPLQSRRRASCSGAGSENGLVVYAEDWLMSLRASPRRSPSATDIFHLVQCGVIYGIQWCLVPPLPITVTSRRRVACARPLCWTWLGWPNICCGAIRMHWLRKAFALEQLDMHANMIKDRAYVISVGLLLPLNPSRPWDSVGRGLAWRARLEARVGGSGSAHPQLCRILWRQSL